MARRSALWERKTRRLLMVPARALAATAAAPTVSSITPDFGDRAGSVAVTISGSDFTGATSGAIGGTALTSFVVVNDTTITAVTPAKANGTYDVTVTGPGGTGTLAGGYTAWDPSALTTTGWWRADYAGSPWSDESGNARHLTEATNAPSVGAAVNGWDPADFDGTNDLLTAPGTLDTYANSGAWTFVFLYYADTVPADPGAGSRYLTESLLSDSGAYLHIALTDSGVTVEAADGIGASSTLTRACSTGAYHMICAKYDGADLNLGIDATAYGTPEAYAALGALTGTVKIGTNWDGSAFVDGRMAEVIAFDTALSDANRTNLRKYFNTRYGLSL